MSIDEEINLNLNNLNDLNKDLNGLNDLNDLNNLNNLNSSNNSNDTNRKLRSAMMNGKDDEKRNEENKNENQLSIEISAEVQSTIEQVLTSDDPLDKSDFNLVNYINELFPNEQSLASIDDVLNEMKLKISYLDDEIRTVVRRQNITESEGKEALINAKDVILQLTNRIKTIKEKARNSQKMVDEITCDIKQLDNAKRNLTSSIVMLNNLHILVEGVSKLDNCIDQRNYMQVAAILQSLIGVLNQLNKYRNNPHIKKLASEVDSLKDKLFKQIMNDFNSILDNSSKLVQPNHIKLLSESCLVIDTLGDNEKKQFFNWFIDLQLKEYRSVFSENDEISWLEKIDKRYTWLKKYLLDFEDKFGKMFPSAWEISEQITVEFCRITVSELSEIMSKRKDEINVKLLLFAFNKTMLFENLLSVRFTGITLLPKENKDQVIAKLKETNTNLFTGIISNCFEPYLNIYVECQDKQLEQMIDEFVMNMNKETSSSSQLKDKNENKVAEVFASSGLLFTQYKNFLVQCVKLSTKRPLVQLSNTFQKYLREYANRILLQNLPKNSLTGASNAAVSLMNSANMFSASGLLQSLLKEGDDYKFTKSELVQICSVLLTANYCVETIQQLEKKLQEKIDSKYVNKIDMKPELELFRNIISNCINLLMQYIDAGCESAFNAMIKTQWSNVRTPTGPCLYVKQLEDHLQQIFPFIRENLQDSRKHFAQLCNTFAVNFTQKFYKCLVKCKPLRETAAEQLLHDTHTLKKVLLGLPGHESAIKTAPTNYTKTIIKGMTRAENILQVILIPIVIDNEKEDVKGFAKNYIKLLPDSNLSEFQKILEMKDVKKADLNRLCDAYKNETKANATGNEENYDQNDDSSKVKHLEKLIRRTK